MQRQALLITVVATAFIALNIVVSPIRVYASEDIYTGVVTQEEMDKEVAMYDEETGEFFFVKDQETADECTEKYGWSQVTKECVNTGVPDYIKKAGEESASLSVQVEDKKTEDAAIAEDDESVVSEISNDAESTNSAQEEGYGEPEEALTQEDAASEGMVANDINAHGPFTELNDDAKDALLGLLTDESIGDDERYIEIYGTASNIAIDAHTWSKICDAGKEFSIKVVGAKENILYQYNFSSKSFGEAQSDIELKLTAAAEDDAHTYMSFHKTQNLPGAVELVYPQLAARTNYELRSTDGEVIANGTSDDDGILSLTIEQTDNYELVDIDNEVSAELAGVDKQSASKKPFIFAGICVVIAIVAGAAIFIIQKKRR